VRRVLVGILSAGIVEVTALGTAAIAAFVTSVWVIALRGSGGWWCLQKLRRGVVTECRSRTWFDLDPVERAWFYGTLAFGALAIILALVGLVSIAL
jgi:hypothetical protein